MNQVQDIHRELSRPHNHEFKGNACEPIHEALRYLQEADWETLLNTWHEHDGNWVCNLVYCLDPDYHPQQAEQLLVDILRRGHPDARAYAADTLLLNSLYVPDAPMREHLQCCIAQSATLPDENLRKYRQQLFQSLLAKQPVQRIPEAHEHSIHNRAALALSKEAACYYCRTIFPAAEVTEFIDNGETAMCPHCGIDAVLPDNAGYPLNYMTLRALHQYWF